jgi:autotransporter-associated beta strand protein
MEALREASSGDGVSRGLERKVLHITGVIGSANLVKTGAGTLQFNGVTSYTGKTTVAAGTLTLAGADWPVSGRQ